MDGAGWTLEEALSVSELCCAANGEAVRDDHGDETSHAQYHELPIASGESIYRGSTFDRLASKERPVRAQETDPHHSVVPEGKPVDQAAGGSDIRVVMELPSLPGLLQDPRMEF